MENFTLKREHLLLLENLRWGIGENKTIVSLDTTEEEPVLFGSDNIYDDIDLILNGRPKAQFIDPTEYNPVVYTPEQIAQWDNLLAELPTAVEIILRTGKFFIGNYTCNFIKRDWKLVKP
jgi:hypothetical protein